MRVTLPNQTEPLSVEQRTQLKADIDECVSELEANTEMDFQIQSILLGLAYFVQHPTPE